MLSIPAFYFPCEPPEAKNEKSCQNEYRLLSTTFHHDNPYIIFNSRL